MYIVCVKGVCFMTVCTCVCTCVSARVCKINSRLGAIGASTDTLGD